MQLIQLFELAQLETYLPYSGFVLDQPLKSRETIARAFVAKAIYNRTDF